MCMWVPSSVSAGIQTGSSRIRGGRDDTLTTFADGC